MSNPIPSQIALAQITNGTLADGSVVQSNDSAIQAAVNALIVALSGGSNGQFLKAVDGFDVVWEAAASLVSTAVQAFSGPIYAKSLGVSLPGSSIAVAAGALQITGSLHVINATDGTSVTNITGRSGAADLLFLRNSSGANIPFATGGATGTQIASSFVLGNTESVLLLWDGTYPSGEWQPYALSASVNSRSPSNVLSYGTTVTPDASRGALQTVTITNATAFTVAAPLNPPTSGETGSFYLELFNNSGGAHGTITFNAAYINPGSPVIANGKKKLLGFTWNGASWVVSGGSTADY